MGKDMWGLISSALILLGLIFTILKWNFPKENVIGYIKAIFIMLLILAYVLVVYAILTSKKPKKRATKQRKH
jgi:cbb3-type cytochrome oxidase subunit 3